MSYLNYYRLGYENAKKKLGWRSVKESTPKESGWYFTCINDNGVPQCIGCSYYHFDTDTWYNSDDEITYVDYWMNIPKF